MPRIKVEIAYSLHQEIALERIKGLLGKLKSDYAEMITDMNEQWTGNGSSFSFKVMGMKVKGNLRLTPSQVIIDGDLPLAAYPFKKTIVDKIREEAVKLLK
jgi:hypothetical protein